MTLVVARKEKNPITDSELIFIVSDTRVTAHYLHGGMPLHWKNSVIKTSIINENICVSWAGKCDEADASLKKFNANGMNDKPRKEIINFFYEEHLNSLNTDKDNQGVDFILTFGGKEIEIVEIKNRKFRRNCSTAWIGTHSAFEEFQSNMLSQNLQNLPLSIRMEKSMQFVVESVDIPEVGDFAIKALYSPEKGFIFAPRFENINYSQRLLPGINHIGIGDVASGSFTVSLNICLNVKNALAFYFNQGNFGLLYTSNDGGILRVLDQEVIRVNSPDEFSKIVLQKYGLNIPVCFK